MKKQNQILIAAGMLALASSCNTNPAADPAAEQAKIDSMVNARVEEIRMDLMAKNDSTIMVLAREKADSILVAMGKPDAAKKVAPKKNMTTRDKGTVTQNDPDNNQPTNTGKTGDQNTGSNTGKKGDQNTGTNTGKKGN